jgi:leucyl-tRNA synthetase
MAVPAHDERDFEFAKKYGIEITQSIAAFISEKHDKTDYPINHINSFTSIIQHPTEEKYLVIKFLNNKYGFV